VQPNEKALAAKAKSLGVEQHEMYHNDRIKDAVLKDMLAVGKSAGLAPLEMVVAVLFSDEEWIPASVGFFFVQRDTIILLTIPSRASSPPRTSSTGGPSRKSTARISRSALPVLNRLVDVFGEEGGEEGKKRDGHITYS
jgi:hypothetical protein